MSMGKNKAGFVYVNNNRKQNEKNNERDPKRKRSKKVVVFGTHLGLLGAAGIIAAGIIAAGIIAAGV